MGIFRKLIKHIPQIDLRRLAWRRLVATLAALLCVNLSQGAKDSNLIDRVARALELRKELLIHYSTEVEGRILANLPFGNQKFETLERHYLGDPGKFKREVLSLKRNGLPMDPLSRRGSGSRFMNMMPQLQGLDILTFSEIQKSSVHPE